MHKPYLTPESEDAFKDFTLKDQQEAAKYGMTILCPKCRGYGGWNLEINAYGEGKHFRAHCSQCHGWGYVSPGLDATCIHEFERTTIRMFEHVETCKKCGRSYSVDSSG